MEKAELEFQANQRFEYLVNSLIVRFRFVHQILGMMTKTPDYNLDTMGVWVTDDGRFRLGFSPAYMATLSDAEATYVFYHEVLHLALLHCTARRLGETELANIAQDLAVNELIPIDPVLCSPPKDEKGNLTGCHVSEFKKKKEFEDIKDKQSAEWYYDYLRQKIQKKADGGGKGKKGKGKGKAGLPTNGSFDTHEGWQEHEVAHERAAAKIREINDTDTWGTMSQTTKEMILAAQVRKINWRNLIRVWFGNQAWKDRIYTRKRPNRRTGLMHPGTRRMYVDRWLVAADTSGSVDAELLAEWIGVLNQLAEELPIDFMQFDWDKTTEPVPYDKRMQRVEFHGRGGTNFQPVMDMVAQRRYKGVMILTDGEASEPTRPATARVLWVLPAGKNPPCEWGERIHMQKHV